MHRRRHSAIAGTREARAPIVTALLATVLLGLLLLTGCSRGPLDDSTPAEVTIRAMRLAGMERASVAEEDSIVSVRVEVPGPDTIADVQLAWQAALGAASQAYPAAERYIVRCGSDEHDVFDASFDGEATREAVRTDEADALWRDAQLAFLPGEQDDAGASLREPDAVLVSPEDAAYIDAKNRAAGLLGDEGPTGVEATELRDSAALSRAEAPGRPAPQPTEAAEVYAGIVIDALGSIEADGEQRVIDFVARSTQQLSSASVADLRTLSLFVAAAADPPGRSVLGGSAALALQVEEARLAGGAASDAILVATRSSEAPDYMSAVASFEVVDEEFAADPMPAATVSAALVAGVQEIEAGRAFLVDGSMRAPQAQQWRLLRRADGRHYVVGSLDDDIALCDASVRGWAFERAAINVVSAVDVGVIHATLPLTAGMQ